MSVDLAPTELDLISEMYRRQFELQTMTYRYDLPDMTPGERANFVQWNIVAAVDELHEALAEVGWKPWASRLWIRPAMVISELVDFWHFFMNLGLAYGYAEGRTLYRIMKESERQHPPRPPRFPSGLYELTRDAIPYEVLNIEEQLHRLRTFRWPDYAISYGTAANHFFRLLAFQSTSIARLHHLYMQKSAVNVKRQADGYDGVSTKCQQCHRELSEAPESSQAGFCGICKPTPVGNVTPLRQGLQYEDTDDGQIS